MEEWGAWEYEVICTMFGWLLNNSIVIKGRSNSVWLTDAEGRFMLAAFSRHFLILSSAGTLTAMAVLQVWKRGYTD